jgi:hypothetical protein
VRIVLAAAYGTKRSASNDDSNGPPSPTATPINITTEMLVGILPSADEQTATLQLTQAEWAELWDRFRTSSGLLLSSMIGRYLYSVCAGQVSGCMMS